MERRRLVLAVAALLTVAVLGFAATAVDSRGSAGGGETVDSDRPENREPANTSIAAAIVLVLVVVAVGSLVYAGARGTVPRWLAAVVAILLILVLALVGLGYVLDPPEPATDPDEETTPGPDQTPVPAAEEGESEDGDAGSLSATGTLVVLVLLVLAGVFGIARFARGGSAGTAGEEPDEQAAVGDAAGRAASELEETTLSNAIYRAWSEMTDALDVESPETTTPSEFENAAVEVGVDRADAATLTDLFRAVRYGDTPATPEREARARETLRRIEREYGAAENSPTAGDVESVGTDEDGAATPADSDPDTERDGGTGSE